MFTPQSIKKQKGIIDKSYKLVCLYIIPRQPGSKTVSQADSWQMQKCKNEPKTNRIKI